MATLAMPGGTSLPYNNVSVDTFPTWAALGKAFSGESNLEQGTPESDIAA